MPYYGGRERYWKVTMAIKVTDEGQLTIPRPALEHLGIGPGSEVAFRCAGDGTVVLAKAEAGAERPASRLSELVGIAGPGLSTEEIMAMTRGE
jgi:AbrB family looped-hinge helix DNA binding protein